MAALAVLDNVIPITVKRGRPSEAAERDIPTPRVRKALDALKAALA